MLGLVALLGCDSPPQCVDNDQDCDGFPSWEHSADPDLADCDDSDPAVTPATERLVPAGAFLRGDSRFRDASPQREIELPAYCMDRTEVSNAQFVELLRAWPANQDAQGQPWFDAHDSDDEFDADLVQGWRGWRVRWGRDDYPVTEVYLGGAWAYCDWLGKRVPTEAEWEKAARGTDGRAYPWGDEEPSCELANYGGSGIQQPPCHGHIVEVDQHPRGASPYGLQDMAGNVSEWVSDWYREDYYQRAPSTSPAGPESGLAPFPDGNLPARLTRGGAALGLADQLHVSARFPEPEQATSNGIGFRCLRPLE